MEEREGVKEEGKGGRKRRREAMEAREGEKKEGRHGRENVKGRRDGLEPRQRVIVMHFE